MANAQRKAAFLEIVDNQLRDGDPPETRQTYERLLAEGYSDENVRLMIGNLLVHEIYDMLKRRRTFDRTGFVANLARLPKLPEE